MNDQPAINANLEAARKAITELYRVYNLGGAFIVVAPGQAITALKFDPSWSCVQLHADSFSIDTDSRDPDSLDSAKATFHMIHILRDVCAEWAQKSALIMKAMAELIQREYATELPEDDEAARELSEDVGLVNEFANWKPDPKGHKH